MQDQSPEVDQRYSDTYHDLVRYIKWLARHYSVPGHWLLNEEDLMAEGFFMLTKLVPRYMHLPYSTFLTVAKTAINNWIRTLYSRANKHKRSCDWGLLSTDSIQATEIDGTEFQELNDMTSISSYANYSNRNPEMVLIFAEQFAEVVKDLTDFDRSVLDCLNGDNPRVAMYLELSRNRRNYVFKSPTITITPHIISRALCVTESDVRKSFGRLQVAFDKQLY